MNVMPRTRTGFCWHETPTLYSHGQCASYVMRNCGLIYSLFRPTSERCFKMRENIAQACTSILIYCSIDKSTNYIVFERVCVRVFVCARMHLCVCVSMYIYLSARMCMCEQLRRKNKPIWRIAIIVWFLFGHFHHFDLTPLIVITDPIAILIFVKFSAPLPTALVNIITRKQNRCWWHLNHRQYYW